MQREAKCGEKKDMCIVVEELHLFPCILGKPTQVREKSRRKELQDNVRKFITNTIMPNVVNITSNVYYEKKKKLSVNCEEYTGGAVFLDFNIYAQNTLMYIFK